MLLDRNALVDGLSELGARAAAAGKIIDLSIYGGSCLILVSNFRSASQDVDGVASTDQIFVDRIVGEIAADRGWPHDWLNDGVRVYLSPNVEAPADHNLFGTYPSEQDPGVRIFVPTAEYMLAMKLMAMRIDQSQDRKDLADIENLIRIVGISSKAALIELAARYYPEARVSPKLILSADRILAAVLKEQTHEAPRYLDRGGPGDDGK